MAVCKDSSSVQPDESLPSRIRNSQEARREIGCGNVSQTEMNTIYNLELK
jgi:hypothetical protein